jgi:hypothetical protein
LPGGKQAVALRALRRPRIRGGVTGAGAALWVDAEPVQEITSGERIDELACEYKALVRSILQERRAWQVVDSVQRITEPAELADMAGYASTAKVIHNFRRAERAERAGLARLVAFIFRFVHPADALLEAGGAATRARRPSQPSLGNRRFRRGLALVVGPRF